MEENKRISDLFERARNEAPKTSFEDVKGHFLATGAVAGTGLLAKWAAASFKLKAIIMTSTLITLTISGLLVSSYVNSNPVNEDPIKQNEIIVPQENLEIIQEDGVKETIIYDDKDQVLEVIVDSSNKFSAPIENKELMETPIVVEPNSLTVAPDPIPSLSPTMDPKIEKADKPEKERRFTITEKTSKEELEKIKTLAENAGIRMTYTARIKKNIIKRLSMNWNLNGDSGRSNWSITVSGDDDFSVEVGWEENDKGQATGFLDDKRIEARDKGVEVIVDSEGNRIRTKN